MRCIPPSLLFLVLGLSTSCIEIGDVYPYHLSGDDDDSAGDDDDDIWVANGDGCNCQSSVSGAPASGGLLVLPLLFALRRRR